MSRDFEYFFSSCKNEKFIFSRETEQFFSSCKFEEFSSSRKIEVFCSKLFSPCKLESNFCLPLNAGSVSPLKVGKIPSSHAGEESSS